MKFSRLISCRDAVPISMRTTSDYPNNGLQVFPRWRHWLSVQVMAKYLCLLLVSCFVHAEADAAVTFPDVTTQQPKLKSKSTGAIDPRFGSSFGFGMHPSGNGGVSGSFSSSFSGEGNSASQSFSFQAGAQGFSASQSSSQSSNYYDTHFPGYYRPSFSSSQSSSISAGPGGGAASSAASQAGNFGGMSVANSQSASNSFNHAKRPSHRHRKPPSDLFVFSS